MKSAMLFNINLKYVKALYIGVFSKNSFYMDLYVCYTPVMNSLSSSLFFKLNILYFKRQTFWHTFTLFKIKMYYKIYCLKIGILLSLLFLYIFSATDVQQFC